MLERWEALYNIASTQVGYFTTKQADAAGFSKPLLAHHISRGRLSRARRGVYRLVHYPAGEHDDLMILWLWSNMEAVFSHETALFLHDLSDALPARAYAWVPEKWHGRRLRIPDGLVLQFADVWETEKTWRASVPVTSVRRTLSDCINSDVDPVLVRQAIAQSLERGLVSADDVAAVAVRA